MKLALLALTAMLAIVIPDMGSTARADPPTYFPVLPNCRGVVLGNGAAPISCGLTSPQTTLNGSIMGTPFVATGNGATGSAGNAARWGHNQNLIDDFSASCDGSSDDTGKATSAAAAGPIRIPGLVTLCKTTFTLAATPNQLIGPGRLIGVDGNDRAPITTNLTAPPSSYGNWNTPSTAFNGDLSGVWSPHQHMTTGAATLTQPVSGYVFHPETFALNLDVYNTSGWNQATTGNGGRTGTGGLYLRVDQYGQGDLSAIWCNGIAASIKPGSTNLYANPQAGCIAGGLVGGANGVYLELLGDLNIGDNGFDIGGIAETFNFTRTKGAEAGNASWIGHRLAALTSTVPIDAIDQIAGPFAVGYDLSEATLGTYRLANFSIVSGGATCSEGAVLSVSAGSVVTNGPATSFIEHCTSTAVTSLTVNNTGMYSTPPVTTFTTLVFTAGPGSDANITGQYANDTAMLLPTNGGCFRPSQVPNVNVTQGMTGVYNSLCVLPGAMTFGGLNNVMDSTVSNGNFAFGDHDSGIGINSFLVGTYAYDYGQRNATYISSGSFGGVGFGRSQRSIRIFRATGTGNLTLTTDTNVQAPQNSFNAPLSSGSSIAWRCNAVDTTNLASNNQAFWGAPWKSGVLTRGSSGASTYVGDGSTAVAFDRSAGTVTGATIAIAAAGSGGGFGLTFTFTPPAGGANWRATCDVDADLLTGG